MNRIQKIQFVGYQTIVRRQLSRLFRIWPETLLPPAITTSLYYLIFGTLLGSQIAELNGYSFMQFIIPGLIVMNVLNNAYTNVAFAVFSDKFMHSIEEQLTAPLSNFTIFLGYISGGILRGLIVGLIVTIISLAFAPLKIHSPVLMTLIILFTAILFASAGFINALYAKKWDDTSIIPTFVLTPMTYLGGIFYSIKDLPEPWHTISLFNPILYLVNSFRYSLLGISDVSVNASVAVLSITTILVGSTALLMLKKGYGLRT